MSTLDKTYVRNERTPSFIYQKRKTDLDNLPFHFWQPSYSFVETFPFLLDNIAFPFWQASLPVLTSDDKCEPLGKIQQFAIHLFKAP